jgi:hypothetical protein
MDHENISEIVKVAICICAEDGLVSETEENAVYELISKRFPNYSQDSFSKAVKDFFSSDKQLEDYLKVITDPELQKFTLEIGKVSAASDGLDFRENIAVEKASVFWKIKK